MIAIVELRLEAIAEMERADRAQDRARTQRQRIAAQTRARTALAMLLLSEAPIRIDSLAGVEIGRQLSPDLRTISLSAHETKEGESDQRCVSDVVVAALRSYIRRHRSLVAPETTNAYTGTAGQVMAGRRLHDAAVATATAIGANAAGLERPAKARRPRSLRAELAERAARRRAEQKR